MAKLAEPVQEETPAVEKKESLTKWGIFVSANVVPTEIVCDGYRSFHSFDSGCHTRLRLSADAMEPHVDGEHGGGFMFALRKSDKPWSGWKRFGELGLEITDLRCDVCDKVLPQNAMHIMNHMKPHNGKTRRTRPGGIFNITLSKTPSISEQDAFADAEA